MRVNELDPRLEAMRYELIKMAEKEAYKLWKLARKAEKRGVSEELVRSIREEARNMYETMTAYPERLIAWDFKYKYKYAFKY